MTWTYGGDPSGSARDAVRLRCGDTDSSDPLVTDEEITYFLDINDDSVNLAAASALDAMAAKKAREADKRIGDLAIQASQASKRFSALAEQLRQQGAALGADGIGDVAPFSGSLSMTSKDQYIDNTNNNPPLFKKGDGEAAGSAFSYPARRGYAWRSR